MENRPLPPDSPQARALAHVAARSRGPGWGEGFPVTVNFHPDRTHQGAPLLRVLAEEGVYRSQFETGTSNGGLTAHPGGDRWRWESRIFGGAYDGAPPRDRPKYGALNHRHAPRGAAPRFGSAHFRLKPELARRCTFCYPDSVFEPCHFGIVDNMAGVTQALARAMDDPLDDYIEAHVHGPIRLAHDVEALVLDPCFRGTETEAWARRLPCTLEWHAGFRLPVEVLLRYPDYRGPRYVALGTRIAAGGCIDPATLGDALRSGRHDPADLKKVWHYVARYGAA